MIGRTILTIATFVLLVFSTPRAVVSPANSQDTQTTGNELVSGYKNWTRVNPVPALMPSRVATLCAPTLDALMGNEKENPHSEKFITVYVNDLGRRSMMEQRKPKYPQGSIIVKEKLTTKESTSPELLTVMIKCERGYNPGNGDWEYMSLDGAGEKVLSRGKLEKCQACHQRYSNVDFVSRNYLPTELWRKLK